MTKAKAKAKKDYNFPIEYAPFAEQPEIKALLEEKFEPKVIKRNLTFRGIPQPFVVFALHRKNGADLSDEIEEGNELNDIMVLRLKNGENGAEKIQFYDEKGYRLVAWHLPQLKKKIFNRALDVDAETDSQTDGAGVIRKKIQRLVGLDVRNVERLKGIEAERDALRKELEKVKKDGKGKDDQSGTDAARDKKTISEGSAAGSESAG